MKVMTTPTSERQTNDTGTGSATGTIWVERKSDERSEQNERENIGTQASVRETSTYSAPPPPLIPIEKPTTPELQSQVGHVEQTEGTSTTGKGKKKRRKKGRQLADDQDLKSGAQSGIQRSGWFAVLEVEDDA